MPSFFTSLNPAYQLMIGAWLVVIVWVGLVIYFNRKVHPKVLFALFLVELWERFSYYGNRAFLVFYITRTTMGGFGLPKQEGNSIYAAYGALVYLTPLLGGFLADRFLGFRKSIVWGALLMAAGQFTLASSQHELSLLYTGLGLLTIGNGFFKPNISSLVSKYYLPGDPRRDGAFTIFYMGINLGAFLAPLTCGAVAEIEGWNYGFLLAGSGMIVGLAFFIWTIRSGLLQHYADPPAAAVNQKIGAVKIEYAIYVGTFLLLPIAALLIRYNDAMDWILAIFGAAVISFMIFISFQYSKIERERIWVIIVLLIFTAIFWTFFELAGSAMNLFTDANVDKHMFGTELNTTFFQAVNPFFIMIFAPIISYLWIEMGKRNKNIPAPFKFAIGIALLGCGFLSMNLGKQFVHDGLMPAIFLILLYLLHTLGELVLSPVGLSLVTKLAPAKIVGFMLGFWFLSSAIALQATKSVSKLFELDDKSPSREKTLEFSMGVFNQIGLFSLGAAAVLVVLSPLLTKWMHGVEKPIAQQPPSTNETDRTQPPTTNEA